MQMGITCNQLSPLLFEATMDVDGAVVVGETELALGDNRKMPGGSVGAGGDWINEQRSVPLTYNLLRITLVGATDTISLQAYMTLRQVPDWSGEVSNDQIRRKQIPESINEFFRIGNQFLCIDVRTSNWFIEEVVNGVLDGGFVRRLEIRCNNHSFRKIWKNQMVDLVVDVDLITRRVSRAILLALCHRYSTTQYLEITAWGVEPGSSYWELCSSIQDSQCLRHLYIQLGNTPDLDQGVDSHLASAIRKNSHLECLSLGNLQPGDFPILLAGLNRKIQVSVDSIDLFHNYFAANAVDEATRMVESTMALLVHPKGDPTWVGRTVIHLHDSLNLSSHGPDHSRYGLFLESLVMTMYELEIWLVEGNPLSWDKALLSELMYACTRSAPKAWLVFDMLHVGTCSCGKFIDKCLGVLDCNSVVVNFPLSRLPHFLEALRHNHNLQKSRITGLYYDNGRESCTIELDTSVNAGGSRACVGAYREFPPPCLWPQLLERIMSETYLKPTTRAMPHTRLSLQGGNDDQAGAADSNSHPTTRLDLSYHLLSNGLWSFRRDL